MKLTRFDQIKFYLPTIGILLFFFLYIISTFYYPGGNSVNRNAEGYSWMHNYWCHLLRKKAINGLENHARPIAIIASVSLCIGVGIFYNYFSKYFLIRSIWRNAVKYLGQLSMVFAAFLFTAYHDTVLNIAGILGGLALIGTLLALKRSQSYGMWWIGYLCLFLIVCNNYIYYTHVFIEYLPSIQQITLVIFLLWLLHLNLLFVKIAKSIEK